jgi:transposase
MSSTGQRRRPQKYPEEMRERAVRMVLEIRERTGERHGAVTRVAKELGVGTESVAAVGEPGGGRLGSPSGDVDGGRAAHRRARVRRALRQTADLTLDESHPDRRDRWAPQLQKRTHPAQSQL